LGLKIIPEEMEKDVVLLSKEVQSWTRKIPIQPELIAKL
jgi:hypothetical protein